MSKIKVEESDCFFKGAIIDFSNGVFNFDEASTSTAKKIIYSNEIKSLNRLRVRQSSGTNTNVFKNNFTGGTVIAMVMELAGFASKQKKLNRPIYVRLKDGTFFRGKTDLDTFFEVQNSWLDSKSDIETTE